MVCLSTNAPTSSKIICAPARSAQANGIIPEIRQKGRYEGQEAKNRGSLGRRNRVRVGWEARVR